MSAAGNGKSNAYPDPLHSGGGTGGLTKRELFAAMAMQGFAADPKVAAPAAGVAQLAVKWADALLTELEKQP